MRPEVERTLGEQQLTAALEYLRIDELMGRPAHEIMRELFSAADLACASSDPG